MSAAETETTQETAGGVWMDLESYAATFRLSDPAKRRALMRRFHDLLNENSTRTRRRFDPRHVKRISRELVMVYVTRPNAAGESAPRIIERAKK